MIKWELLDQRTLMERTKVPGGWLVKIWIGTAGSIAFYPDPNHEWDGNSLP